VSADTLIWLALLVPLAGCALILVTGNTPNLREAVTLVTATGLFAVVAALLPGVAAGNSPQLLLARSVTGLELKFVLEPLGMLFALVASGLWIVTSIYSIGYMRGNREKHQTRFYACFALSLAATMGIAFAGNLLTLFFFYEALTLATYPLVAHKGDDAARRGARTYLGILLGTSIVFFLLAIIWTWHIAGTLEFTHGGILRGKAGPGLTAVLLALYVFGIGKAALMPFHRWLPAAMVAPTPVSALLHAVAVVKAGVFSIIKVLVYIFGTDHLAEGVPTDWLIGIAGLTIIIASIVALRQDNLKARLAYSTISQLSYIVLAGAILAPLSIIAATLHIAAHAFGKITLFFAAGSIYTASGKTNVSQLNGIGRAMPWTMGAFAVGTLSMIGVPPAAGFISKWFLLQGAVQAEQFAAIGIIVLSTLLNAGYFLPIVYAAFLRAPDEPPTHGEAPKTIVVALTVTAALSIAMFFWPQPALDLARLLVEARP